MQDFDWYSSERVLNLPVAADWAKPFRARVAAAKGRKIFTEAGRATLEALGRKLRSQKWQRRRTSKAKWDGRADSRYYRSPHNRQFEIRISNHVFPTGTYSGARDYIITRDVMLSRTVDQLVQQIVRDEGAHRRTTSRKANQNSKQTQLAKAQAED